MIKIERTPLVDLLASAARVAARGSMPALACVRLAYDGHALTVDATDLLVRLTIPWATVVGDPQPWTALVNAKDVLAAAQAMPSGKGVTLSPELVQGSTEARTLLVASGDRKKTLPSLVDAGFPAAWEAPPLAAALEIPAGVLIRLIEGTLWAASTIQTDAARSWMTGVRLRWDPAAIVASATNGNMQTFVEIAGTGETRGDVVLPGRVARAIGLIGKTATEDDAVALQLAYESPVKIATDGRRVRLDAGGATLLAMCLSDPITLPSPELSGPHIHMPRAGMLDALKAMRGHTIAKVVLDGDSAALSSETMSGRATDRVPGAEGTPGFSVVVGVSDMVHTLSRWDCDRIAIHVEESSVAVVPHPAQGQGNMTRFSRYKGDETPGVPAHELTGPCPLCYGGPLFARLNASGTKTKFYVPARAMSIDVVQILGGKKEIGDSPTACPVCTDTPVPVGCALVRGAK